MMPPLETSLAVLRDVPGVEGAFVLDELGALLARDEAFALPEAVLASAGARIATLLEAASEDLDAAKELTLTFATHRLVVRVLSPCVLVVLVRAGGASEAVRMASNIALRQMVRKLGGGAEPSAPGLHRAVAFAPSSSRLAASAPALSAAKAASARPALPKAATTAPPKKKPKNDIWG